MKRYGKVARAIGKVLEPFPALRAVLREGYQYGNYLFYRDKNFTCALHPQVRLYAAHEWAKAGQEADSLGSYFFGYYDKTPWSADMQQAVFHCIRDNGSVEITLFDRERQQLQVLGRSTAYNLQQGSMAQWLPASAGKKVVYNCFAGDHLGSVIVDIETGQEKSLPWPVQTLHPDGKGALTLNYDRLRRLQTDYGYALEASNLKELSLDEDGIWYVCFESGEARLLISLSRLISHQPREEMEGAQHKVNHIIYAPDGNRFVFVHRWLTRQGKFSRLYVASGDGQELRLLMDDRVVSHYHWLDRQHVVVWGRTQVHGDQYYLIDVETGEMTPLGEGVLDGLGDGHPSVSPDGKWLITDTYPDRARQQHLLLYHFETKELVRLGSFLSPWQYRGESRCDLHPRWSPDGRWISFDSTHEGERKSYMLDISQLVKKEGE